MSIRRKTAQIKQDKPKDEGPRYAVVDAYGRPFYLLGRENPGLPQAEAQRLADGLREDARIIPVEEVAK